MLAQETPSVPLTPERAASVVVRGSDAEAVPETLGTAMALRLAPVISEEEMTPGVGGMSVWGSFRARVALPAMLAVPLVMVTPRKPRLLVPLSVALAVRVALSTGLPVSTRKNWF